MTSPIYIGAFLTPESRALLLEKIPPRHLSVHADHVTISFRPHAVEQFIFVPGRAVELRVLQEMFDDKAQAVIVDGVPTRNQRAHITVSVSGDTKPFYSNELIHKVDRELLRDNRKIHDFYLQAVLDYYPRTTT